MGVKKISSIFIALIMLTSLNLFFSYLKITFGWTNPNGIPPAGYGAFSFNGGNIGVGTANPTAKLHVQGGVKITGLVSCDTIDTDANGILSCGTDDNNGIGGSGTQNYLAKFTNTTTIGNSVIYDNGTNVGIGTTNPTTKLYVSGDIYVQGKILNECAWPVYVGKTSTTYDGSQGGYSNSSGADSKCNSAFSGSHVCSADEIQRSIRCSATPATNTWYNNYVYLNSTDTSSGAATTVSDCKSWVDKTTAYGGSVFTGGPPGIATCDKKFSYACCK